MLRGKRFKLKTPTIAVGSDRVAVQIPAGEIVEVISGPSKGDQMVQGRWNGRPVLMFATDLMVRAQQIPDSASAP